MLISFSARNFPPRVVTHGDFTTRVATMSSPSPTLQAGTPPSAMPISEVAHAVRRMLGGETLAEIREVAEEQLEATFSAACDLVDSEDFDGAIDHLLSLVIHDPYDHRFQFGYALCLQQLGRFQDAAKHFGLACMLEPDEPATAFRLGECLAALGDRDLAADAFGVAIGLCETPGADAEIRIASEAALQRLHA